MQSRLVGTTNASISIFLVLSVTNITVNGPVVQTNSLWLPFVTVSSKVSLHSMSGPVIPFVERRNPSRKWMVYTWPLDCSSIRYRTDLSKSPF